MHREAFQLPPLKIVLAIFLGVVLLQFPADLIISRVSLAWGVLIDEVVFILALPLAVISIAGYSLKPLLPFKKSGGKNVLVAICTMIGVSVVLSYVKTWSSELIPIPASWVSGSANIMLVYSWNDFFLKLILLGLVAPCCEEILFRSMIQRPIERRFGKWMAIFLTAIFFALLHGTSFQPHLYFLLGFFLAWIFSVTKTLRITILCHAFNNTWALANYIHGIKFPLQMPMGWTDAVLILSAVLMISAGIFWLKEPRSDDLKSAA